MPLIYWETGVRWAGGLLTAVTLGSLFYGIWRGLQRPVGATTGRFAGWLRSPGFYLAAPGAFFGICGWLWRPMPWPTAGRAAALIVCSLLFFPGLGLVAWGRLVVGMESGVGSLGAFHRTFRVAEGVPPGEYRAARDIAAEPSPA